MPIGSHTDNHLPPVTSALKYPLSRHTSLIYGRARQIVVTPDSDTQTVYLFRTALPGASCPHSCFMNGIYLQCKKTVQNIGWSTEAKGHRDVAQKGVLPSLATGENRQVWFVLWWTVRTACSDGPYRLPWQVLLSYELLVIPAAPAGLGCAGLAWNFFSVQRETVFAHIFAVSN